MQSSLACRRYLQRHIESELTDADCPTGSWQNVLVIPAYKEPPELLQRLAELPAGVDRTLVILVLNRPDSDPDPDANATLRKSCAALPPGSTARGTTAIHTLNQYTDLYLHDLDRLSGPVPAAQGVGLARKIGCDLAFRWMIQGVIDGPWINSGDADAQFPPDYFTQLERLPPKSAAAIYPFYHVPGPDAECNAATALYELRLHQYRLGLEYADSPYGLHTLGSCLAVKADHYAQVHGFPKRAGGEDFYLLNKLAKTGPIEKLRGNCVRIQSRHSLRVPFGTGPAVAAISTEKSPEEHALYYHPACFEALRCLLVCIPALRQCPEQQQLKKQLLGCDLPEDLTNACLVTVYALGLEQGLQHCGAHGKTAEQFLRQFHQWFDAFRTLKFVHGIRDAGWPMQTLFQLEGLQPGLWPGCDNYCEPEGLRAAILRHWDWLV